MNADGPGSLESFPDYRHFLYSPFCLERMRKKKKTSKSYYRESALSDARGEKCPLKSDYQPHFKSHVRALSGKTSVLVEKQKTGKKHRKFFESVLFVLTNKLTGKQLAHKKKSSRERESLNRPCSAEIQ